MDNIIVNTVIYTFLNIVVNANHSLNSYGSHFSYYNFFFFFFVVAVGRVSFGPSLFI